VSEDLLILEGLLTTHNEDGSVNVAPMGPQVDLQLSHWLLRPFPGSRTYENLCRTQRGTFHITDNVEMIAQAAVGSPTEELTFLKASNEDYSILADCCRWFKLEVSRMDLSEQRGHLECIVADRGTVRSFFGLNRGKHAVLEAAILATRTHILPAQQLQSALAMLEPWVEKTGGFAEKRSFAMLRQLITDRIAQSDRVP